MIRHCASCGCRFRPDYRVPSQAYCGVACCRRVRRARWQRRKILTDEDYRANQAAAQRQWRESHPEYWRNYRKAHPDYRERERLLRSERRCRQKAEARGDTSSRGNSSEKAAAKMDSITAQVPLPAGIYLLSKVCGSGAIRRRIELGQASQILQALKSGPIEDDSDESNRLIEEITGVMGCMDWLTHFLPGAVCEEEVTLLRAHMAAGGILSRINKFTKTMRMFYDRTAKAIRGNGVMEPGQEQASDSANAFNGRQDGAGDNRGQWAAASHDESIAPAASA